MLTYRPQRRLWIGFAGFLMALVGAVFVPFFAFAQSALPIPPLTARVMDQTGTLTPPQIAQLSAQLKTMEDTQGAQVVVLMVPSTQPEDIFSYSNRVANAWKIGRKEVGDGVLIVVAKNDRKLRIEIAKSLEGPIPDLAASDIINQAITPAFKQGQYAQGLQAGITQLATRIGGGDPSVRPRKGDAATAEPLEQSPLALLGFVGFAILFILSVRFFGFSNTVLILMSVARGGGNGSSNNGGFGSGGGGNFGGGGASGRW